MRQYAGPQAAGPQEHECGVEAEERGVGELEEGTEKGGEQGRARVDELELVEMVDVGYAEVKGSGEDEFGRGQTREYVEGDDEGAKDELFGYRTLRSFAC